MSCASNDELGMASKATYQITVKGKLDSSWFEWFNGTIMNSQHDGLENLQTMLTCQVRDQAELMGILNRLNSLNLPLLQVDIQRKRGS